MHLFCCLICLFVFSIVVLFLLCIVFLGFAQIFYLRLIQTCSSLHHLLTWHSKSLRSGSSFHLLVLSLHKCRFVAGAAWTGAGWPSSQPARGAILAHPLLNLDGAWAADVQLMLLTEISTEGAFSLLRMGFPQLIIIWGSLQNPVGFPLPCLLPATRSLLLPHPCQTGRTYPAVAKPRGKCSCLNWLIYKLRDTQWNCLFQSSCCLFPTSLCICWGGVLWFSSQSRER